MSSFGSDPYIDSVADSDPGSILDIVKAVLVVVLIQFLFGFAIVPIVGAAGGIVTLTDLIPYSMAVLWLSLYFTAWYFRCRKYGRTLSEGLALKSTSMRSVAVAVGLAVVLAIVLSVLSFAWQAAGMNSLAESPVSKLSEDPTGRFLFCVMAVLVPPFEEVFFRGFIFPVLAARLGAWVSVVLTSLLFALVHAAQLGGDIPMTGLIMVMGFVFTIQRHLTGSLIPGIITHFLYNSLLVCLMILVSSGLIHAEKAPAVIHDSKPSTEEIKQDLLGHRIGEGTMAWNFDSVDEFREFDIEDENLTEESLTYKASVRLKGVIGPGATGNIAITYERVGDGYKLQDVVLDGNLTLE